MKVITRTTPRAWLLALTVATMVIISGCVGKPAPVTDLDIQKTVDRFFTAFDGPSGPDRDTLYATTTDDFVAYIGEERLDIDALIYDLDVPEGSISFSSANRKILQSSDQKEATANGFGHLELIDPPLRISETLDEIIPKARFGMDFVAKLQQQNGTWRISTFSLTNPRSQESQPPSPTLELHLYPNRTLTTGEAFAVCLTMVNTGGIGSYKLSWSLNGATQFTSPSTYELEPVFEIFPARFFDDLTPCLVQQATSAGTYEYKVTLDYGPGATDNLTLSVTDSIHVTVR